MSKPMRLTLLAVLLAIPVAWWILRAAPEELSTLSPAGAHAPPVSSIAPSPRAPEPSTEAPEDDSEDSDDGGVEEEDYVDEEEGTGPCIAVEVTARGAPVPGAHVTAVRHDTDELYRELRPLDVGPDGRGTAWCAPGSYLLAAHAPGFAPSALKIEESDGGTPALAQFQLQPGDAVNGRVVDKDSQEPVPQAHVTFEAMADFATEGAENVIEPTSTTSDSRGAIHLENLAAGTYRVSVEAPGYSSKEVGVRVPRPEPLTLELEGISHLEGEVVDETGAPVAGAEIWLNSRVSSDDENHPPLTDAKGHFSIEVEEGTYTLLARAGEQTGLHEGAVTVVRGGLVDGLIIRLQPSGSMSGKVFLQSTHAPVPHGIVALNLEEHGWHQTVTLDEEGTFHLKRIPPGLYELSLFATDLPQLRRDNLRVEAGQELVVELPVAQQGALEGLVTDGLGRPAEHASITTVPVGESAQERSRRWGTPNDEGHYLLEGLNPGSYRIEVQWASLRQSSQAKPLVKEITIREGETVHADFAFTEVPGEVQGTVQRTGGGPPHYSVRVAAYAAASTTSAEVASSEEADETGHFTLNLLAGAYKLKALYTETDDSGPEQAVTIEAGKVSTVHLTVPDSVTETTGVVLTARGEPADGASVSLIGGNVYATANTDEQGHFTIKTSRESLGATGELRARDEAEEAQLPEVRTGSKNLVVRLVKAAALRGRVSAALGPAVQGFTLQVLRRDNVYSPLRNATPFAGDTFEFVDMPVGQLDLLVRTSDGRCGKATVTTESGQTGNVEVSVGRLGRVTGRLVTATGAPRSAWVQVDSGTKNLLQAYAGKDGRFEIITLEPGPHVLNLGRGNQLPFTLHEGEALDVGDLPPAPIPAPH